MWLYWGKVVLFGQNGCSQAKWWYSEKSGGIRAKVVVVGYKKLYSRKTGYIRAKVVLFGQKWLFSDKSSGIRRKVVVFGQKLW